MFWQKILHTICQTKYSRTHAVIVVINNFSRYKYTLEEKPLICIDLVQVHMWHTFLWEHGEELFQQIEFFYPTTKSDAESFKETMIFLDANIRLLCQTYRFSPVFRSKLLSFLSLQEKNALQSSSNAQQTFFSDNKSFDEGCNN